MATASKPIALKITDAGKRGALNPTGDSVKLLVDLTHVVIGSGRYTPTGKETRVKTLIDKVEAVSGDTDAATNTLQFSATIYADKITPVYEIGLLTAAGGLFAIAASPNEPLFMIYPNVAFVISFGLSLNEASNDKVTVTINPNAGLMPTIMGNHLASPNPHPQYLNQEHLDVTTDPHPQYLDLKRFQLLLEVLIPIGYLHHTHSTANPKPEFDRLLGVDTAWRRLLGKTIVATDPASPYIKDVGMVVGQKGMTMDAGANRPHTYPLHTTNIFERYNPDDVIETVWQISANKTSIDEGAGIRFTVSANNIPDGQILKWTVKEGALNSASNDITTPDNTKSSSVVLKNGSATIDYVTTPDDNEIESQKHVRLTVGAPANLSINVPINDSGSTETVIHISSSTTSGIQLDEYYKKSSGSYPKATDKIRFIVDVNVDIIAPDTDTPAIIDGFRWPAGSKIIVENRGRILGRGGDGGRSAYQFRAWKENGDLYNSKSKGIYRYPERGGNGGTAIKSVSRPIYVENHSIIAGGGGGGGGLGAYSTQGDYNFVVGGGGTGGGAPFGKRSPNEATYTMYLQDQAISAKKMPMPPDGKFYWTLFQRAYDPIANNQGTVGDYHYGDEYKAASYTETRGVYVEAAVGQNKRPTGNFKTYRIGGAVGLAYSQSAYNKSFILNMSQDADAENPGSGGTNISPSIASGWSALDGYIYDTDQDPRLNKGGDGGGLGENGQAGVFDAIYRYPGSGKAIVTTSDNTSWYIPPAAGGLAGYVKEGNVTIENLSRGVAKGR